MIEFDEVKARLDESHGFSEPRNNMLGYTGETVYIARHRNEDNSEQFIAAVNRPHLGESLNSFLQLVAPFRFNGGRMDREWVVNILDGFRPGPIQGSVFETHTKPLHFQTDYFGIGQAVTGFVCDVREPWQDALKDDTLDQPFAGLAAIIRDNKSFGDNEGESDTFEDFKSDSLLNEGYRFPASAYRNGLFAAISWVKDENGIRNFLDHRSTAEVGRGVGLPIVGQLDSYLGKLVIKHFSAPGEFAPCGDGTWALHIGLQPDGKKQGITIRELAPWIQLPMHQPSLANSTFIQAAEKLVAKT